jgi:hypothetical protein
MSRLKAEGIYSLHSLRCATPDFCGVFAVFPQILLVFPQDLLSVKILGDFRVLLWMEA